MVAFLTSNVGAAFFLIVVANLSSTRCHLSFVNRRHLSLTKCRCLYLADRCRLRLLEYPPRFPFGRCRRSLLTRHHRSILNRRHFSL